MIQSPLRRWPSKSALCWTHCVMTWWTSNHQQVIVALSLNLGLVIVLVFAQALVWILVLILVWTSIFVSVLVLALVMLLVLFLLVFALDIVIRSLASGYFFALGFSWLFFLHCSEWMRVVDFVFPWRLNPICLKLRQKEAAEMFREEGQRIQLRISSGLTLETPNAQGHMTRLHWTKPKNSHSINE